VEVKKGAVKKGFKTAIFPFSFFSLPPSFLLLFYFSLSPLLFETNLKFTNVCMYTFKRKISKKHKKVAQNDQ
jgi:hypothetical protein